MKLGALALALPSTKHRPSCSVAAKIQPPLLFLRRASTQLQLHQRSLVVQKCLACRRRQQRRRCGERQMDERGERHDDVGDEGEIRRAACVRGSSVCVGIKGGSLARKLKLAYYLHFRPGSSSLLLDKDSRTHANQICSAYPWNMQFRARRAGDPTCFRT